MKGFDSDLILSPHRERAELFYIWREFIYTLYGLYPAGSYIKVHKGALTNGASIPWLLTFIFPRWHPFYSLAVALHDALVGEFGQAKAMLYVPGQEPREVTWEEAAAIFKEAMLYGYRKSPRWIRSLFYHGVMLNKRVKRLLGVWKK